MNSDDRNRTWMCDPVEATDVRIEEPEKTLFVDFLHGGHKQQNTARYRLTLEQASRLLHQLGICLASQGIEYVGPGEPENLQ